jgi:hypothetical protein
MSHMGITDKRISLYLTQLKREGKLSVFTVQVKTLADGSMIIR